MDPIAGVALKLLGEYAGGKSAEGLLGRLWKWRRDRRLEKLLSSDEISYDKEIESAIGGLVGTGEIEIQVFRAVCVHAKLTSSYNSDHDPVRLDAACVFEGLELGTSELEQVLLTLEARACLKSVRAAIVDPKNLNGTTIYVSRVAVDFVDRKRSVS